MTIAAAYLTSEGVVLGADSATSVNVTTPSGDTGIAQVFEYAQKIFEVGEHGRLGVCAFGAGSIGSTSHRSVVARLADSVGKESLSVNAAADRLLDLVREALGEGKLTDDAGYFLGGWDLGTHNPSCYLLLLKKDGSHDKKALDLGEARFAGRSAFFTRVFHGYDPKLEPNLLEILKQKLKDKLPEGFDAIFEKSFKEAAAPLAAAGLKDIPLREAIDFVHAYLHITVKATKFMFGPPVCGGPVEVGFISTDRRFRWVSHKPFDIAIGGGIGYG